MWNKHFATLTTISIEFSDEIILKIIREKNYLKQKIDLSKENFIF